MKMLSEYCLDKFGEKLYRLSLNGGMTCPNRDGTCGTRGCIFCGEGGSGDFAEAANLPVGEQIDRARARVGGKFHGSGYIAYFQAYTNTYAPVDYLERLFGEAIERPEVRVLSIATRPDCLGADVLSLLKRLNERKPVWVELGLQTIHERTARYIRRGYPLGTFDRAMRDLRAIGAEVIVHVILGLPGESEEDMLETVRYVGQCGARGIKLQMLNVLEGTDLAEEYRQGKFSLMSREEYVRLIGRCARILPENMVAHRLTGDGPKSRLIAPMWVADKKRVLGEIQRELRHLAQG